MARTHIGTSLITPLDATLTAKNIAFNPTTLGIVGTTTNDSAAAGNVGEYVSSYISTPASVGTTGQYKDITSISLTAGDWDISAVVTTFNNGATVTEIDVGVSTTAGNSATGLETGNNLVRDTATTFAPFTERYYSIPGIRASLSGTTIHYLKIVANYSVATPQYRGRISARRVR